MAVTYIELNGDGNNNKSFSFPSFTSAEVLVEVDDVLKTAGTHYNITSYTTSGGGTVVFTEGNIPTADPAQKIRIFRDTDLEQPKALYTAGSSVKAADLNNNHLQLLYALQEAGFDTPIFGRRLGASSVTENNLYVSNSPTNNYVLTADDTVNGGFKWSEGASAITVQDEGGTLSGDASILNFVGTGVSASGSGSTKTITITGGGGGGGGGGGSSAEFTYLSLRNLANDGDAVFDSTQSDFTLVTDGTTTAFTSTSAHSLLVSVGGVIQKPNTGTTTPAEGFSLDGTKIKFGANLATAPNFIISQSEATSVGTPANESVTEAHLGANAPTDTYVLTADSAVTAGFKWAEAGGIGAVADGCIFENDQTISSNYTIASGKGAHSVGPLTVNATVTVNGTWVVS